MAFLDNSGDIILDAVLTDFGRKRLARGDGTFKVTQYAFGDDEVDYNSYDPNHPSGSAYYDLEILQTPILEAFTNNRSSLKSKLISLTNNNLLFLPELVLNRNSAQTYWQLTPSSNLSTGSFLVSVDSDTNTVLNLTTATNGGYLNGNEVNKDNWIRIDQGLNTVKLDPGNSLSAELTEQQYMIQIDNRLGSISDVNTLNAGSPAFIDDDQIATYYVTQNVGGYVEDCSPGPLTGDGNVKGSPEYEVITGPRGTKLQFGILSSNNLKVSTYLFDTLGSQVTQADTLGVTNTYNILNSTVKVTGVTTGYSMDIPVTFCRKV